MEWIGQVVDGEDDVAWLSGIPVACKDTVFQILTDALDRMIDQADDQIRKNETNWQ
jgi:hypothetical protein